MLIPKFRESWITYTNYIRASLLKIFIYIIIYDGKQKETEFLNRANGGSEEGKDGAYYNSKGAISQAPV